MGLCASRAISQNPHSHMQHIVFACWEGFVRVTAIIFKTDMCYSCKPLLGNDAHPTTRSVVESIRGDPEDPGCVAPVVHLTCGPSRERNMLVSPDLWQIDTRMATPPPLKPPRPTLGLLARAIEPREVLLVALCAHSGRSSGPARQPHCSMSACAPHYPDVHSVLDR